MRIFLDTNILLDFLDDKRPRHNFADIFFDKVIFQEEELIISEDILTTVYYVAKKNISRKKLLIFLEMILDKIIIVSFRKDIIKKSIKFCQKNSRLDLEDTLQAVCAQEHDCDMIITNDKKFPKLKIPVKTTKDFLSEYDEEE